MIDPLLKDKEDVFNVVMILAALVASPALLLFVSRPDLFLNLDTAHLLMLLPGIGAGVLLSAVFAVLSVSGGYENRVWRVRRRNGLPVPAAAPVTEWSVLSVTAGITNIVILVLSAYGYWHRLRLGATLVSACAGLMLGALIITAFMRGWPTDWTNPARGTAG